jgi:serine/threonine-protein phosphatase 2B catalytic subunit
MDVFTWSIPFLAEKVTNMLFNILKKGGDMNSDEVEIGKMIENSKLTKKMTIAGKITSVARISKMYTTLREESESLLKIKNISPDGKLPRGLLLAGKPAIKNGNIIFF